MTDPWAYLRDLSVDDIQHDKGECKDTIDDLLDDRAALLAVVPKLEFLAEIRGSFCIYPDKEIEHVGAAVVREIAKKTLAALPEHLKEEALEET